MIAEYAKIPGLLACKNCVLWTVSRFDEKARFGTCRRHSPVLTDTVSHVPVSRWPQTFANEFCGEFIRKEDNGQPTVS